MTNTTRKRAAQPKGKRMPVAPEMLTGNPYCAHGRLPHDCAACMASKATNDE